MLVVIVTVVNFILNLVEAPALSTCSHSRTYQNFALYQIGCRLGTPLFHAKGLLEGACGSSKAVYAGML
jgi:hypothetical protein